MGVVIHQSNPVDFALFLKTSAGAAEFCQTLCHVCKGNTDIHGCGCGCGCIQNVVFAGNMQDDFTQRFSVVHQLEMRFQAGNMLDICRIVVAVRCFAECDLFLSGNAFHCLAGIRVTAVIDHSLGSQHGEFVERLDDIFYGAEIVQVICINIQQHRNIRIKL